MTTQDNADDWTLSSPEGRWCGLGPYYAMFPISFVRKSIERHCPPSGRVLDPFCGRGTTTFVASASGRQAFGTDTNPVAWIYASAKLDPCKNATLLLKRTKEIVSQSSGWDRQPENEFQAHAWHPKVLSFLKSARRNLDWRGRKVDRTLMAIILVHLHAKLGEGLSNQMRQSKSMSPDYAVNWWKKRRLSPPNIDIISFFEKKLAWRYRVGVPSTRGRAEVELGDAREILPRKTEFDADLVLTSPPYFGVTNYEYDNWIRLWMLGGPSLPSYRAAARHADPEKYEELLLDVFEETKRHCKDTATIYVRTDARRFTFETTLDILTELWPRHKLFFQSDIAKGATQTALFQRKWHKAGEVDIILTSRR